MIENSAKIRMYGVDLLKILACFGVVALHTINGSLGIINRVITLICTLCIPMFFVCSGYVMFLKKKISYTYVIKKIIKILLVCFSWEILHAIAYFLYYHQLRNFIESFFLDFFQKGLFFHFWFMGALIILYLILPLLRVLEQKYAKLYYGLLGVLSIVCVCIDIINILTRKQWQLQVTQTFRLWTWLFYYMAGGAIAVHKEWISKQFLTKREIIVIGSLIIVVAWQWIVGQKCFGEIYVEGFHSSLPIMLGTISIFCCIYQASINEKILSIIKAIEPLIMGIYIVHPFILAVIVHFIPIFKNNAVWNLVYWLLVTFVSVVISWSISKIPLIRKLIKI